MESIVFLVIIGICILLLIIGLIAKKPEFIVNFVLRIALGMVGIYLLNAILTSVNIVCQVGFNGVSALTLGLLGAPGFMLLYGVSLYFMLLKK